MPTGTPNMPSRGGSGNWGGRGGGGGMRFPARITEQNRAAKTYVTKDPKRVAAGKLAAETRAENQRIREAKAKRAGVKTGVRAGGATFGVGGGIAGYLAGRNDEKRKQQKSMSKPSKSVVAKGKRGMK